MTNIYELLQRDNFSVTLAEIIAEKKDRLDLSIRQISKILDIPYTTLERIFKSINNNDLTDIDFEFILKLSQFLGISIEDITKIYMASLAPDKVRGIEAARKANYILENFDIKALRKQNFIDTVTDFERIEKRIKSFFGLDSIFEYSGNVGGALFSRTKNLSDDKMRELWVRSAILQFQKIDNQNAYNKDALVSIIPKIRPYTTYVDSGFVTVLKALYNLGVTVIVQKYLSKTQVRGAALIVNNKPCIVVTTFNKHYSTIWFALLHELYHIIYDYDDLKEWSYHLTGEKQSDLYLFREDMANYFAREMLFPQENLNYIKNFINSPAIVAAYADKHKVHLSIIYDFFCYEEQVGGKNYYKYYTKYFGDSDAALRSVITNPWDKISIFEEINKIKSILNVA